MAERLARLILLDPAKDLVIKGGMPGVCSRGNADAVWADYERRKTCDPRFCDPRDSDGLGDIFRKRVTLPMPNVPDNSPKGPGVVDPPQSSGGGGSGSGGSSGVSSSGGGGGLSPVVCDRLTGKCTGLGLGSGVGGTPGGLKPEGIDPLFPHR